MAELLQSDSRACHEGASGSWLYAGFRLGKRLCGPSSDGASNSGSGQIDTNGFCVAFLTMHNGQPASLAERPHIL
jgi:hypothetical protein